MDSREHFGALLEGVERALEESLVRQRAATQQGNLEAMETELDRQKNLVSARQQIEGLRELWPKLVGVFSPSRSEEKEMPQRYRLRLEFWAQLLAKAKKRTDLHAAVSPQKGDWISAGAGIGGLSFAYIIHTKDARVELYLDRRPAKENKRLFDRLVARRDQIELTFGAPLEWQRLDDREASRICYIISGGGLVDHNRWPEIQDKMVDAMVRLERALRPDLDRLSKRRPATSRRSRLDSKQVGLRTPQDAFVLPILQVLVERGGSGSVVDLLDEVSKRMADVLTDFDHGLLTNGQARWYNTAQWARLHLKEQGLLAADSPRGVWQITDLGRSYLREHAGEPAKPNGLNHSSKAKLPVIPADGLPIFALYKGQRYEAILLPNHHIRYGDQEYGSPSGAGMAIIGAKTLNGWRFWQYVDEERITHSISELRE